MNRITALVPRTSDVTLGRRIFRIGEMRLSDLADLQGWLEDRWESPLEALRGSLRHLESRDRRKALEGIWEACEEGPPLWGTHRAHKALNEPEGIIQTIFTILKQFSLEKVEGKWVSLDLSWDGVVEIAEQAGNHPDGWEHYVKMLRKWQPVDNIEELAFMLGMDEASGNGKPITYVQAVVSTCEVYNWTIDYVMGLTLRQFKAARTGGKPREFGIPVQPKTNLKAVVAARRKQIAEEEARSQILDMKGNSHG